MMKIFLRQTDGFAFEEEINEETTVEELKNAISAKFQVPIINIILIHKGEKLLDHFTVQLAGIRNNDSVFYVITKKNYHFGQSNISPICGNNHSVPKIGLRKAHEHGLETNEYLRNKQIHTKQQLKSLDSKFLKVESSRKATMILHKSYYQNAQQYEMYEQTTERKYKTIIPEKADSISEEPLPSIFSSHELPQRHISKKRNKFVRKPFSTMQSKEERDENSSSFQVPL